MLWAQSAMQGYIRAKHNSHRPQKQQKTKKHTHRGREMSGVEWDFRKSVERRRELSVYTVVTYWSRTSGRTVWCAPIFLPAEPGSVQDDSEGLLPGIARPSIQHHVRQVALLRHWGGHREQGSGPGAHRPQAVGSALPAALQPGTSAPWYVWFVKCAFYAADLAVYRAFCLFHTGKNRIFFLGFCREQIYF